MSLNAAIASERSEGKFLVVDGAYVYAAHACAVGEYAADPVEVAQGFLGAPYFWGGRTSVGLDCSGLVQLACEAAGIPCPRDADMQSAELGSPLDFSREKLARGDLVFWDGHVGMMTVQTAYSTPTPTIWPWSRSRSLERGAAFPRQVWKLSARAGCQAAIRPYVATTSPPTASSSKAAANKALV